MFHDIQQNTDQWFGMRAGKVTGSAAAKIMAHDPKRFGDEAQRLALDIALYRITGRIPDHSYTNEHMARGHRLEPVARALYETQMFYTVTNGGFFDNGETGCSPDGLVGNDGMIEIKSVIPPVHLKTMKGGDIDPAYKWQLVFNLNETGRDWIDYISYCPEFPPETRLYVKRKEAGEFEDEFDRMAIRIEDFSYLIEDTQNLITGEI